MSPKSGTLFLQLAALFPLSFFPGKVPSRAFVHTRVVSTYLPPPKRLQ